MKAAYNRKGMFAKWEPKDSDRPRDEARGMLAGLLQHHRATAAAANESTMLMNREGMRYIIENPPGVALAFNELAQAVMCRGFDMSDREARALDAIERELERCTE